MALQVTVNGRFGANLRRPIGPLDDPEQVRKDLESERRITRLKQVREKSNHLARQIREEVSAEKRRQIDKLEQVKQKELNAWRDHVLVKKHQDYRSAIFQVGAAHRAAKEENEHIEQQRQERIEKIRRCRKQALKRSGKASVELRATNVMNLNAEGRASAGTQTAIVEDKENRLQSGCNKPCCKGKRKRTTSCGCASTDGEEEKEDDASSQDDSSILLSDSPVSNRRLQKTPPVILDVEIEETISEAHKNPEGMDINDRFIQTNRKFSHVVRPSDGEDEPQRRPRFTQISDLVRKTTTTIRTGPAQRRETDPTPPPSPTKSLPRSPRKAVEREEPVPAPAPRKSPTKTAKGSPKKTVTAPRNQSTVKRPGLKTNPAPAKVIDAGIQRGQKAKAPATLPKVTAIQEPAGGPARNLQPIPEQAMPPMPNPPLTHCYPMPQNQPYMHPYSQHPMQPYAMPYAMPFPMQAQFPQPHPMYAPQQMMPNQPAVHVPAVTAPPSTAAHSTVSTTTITMSSRQDPKATQSGRVQFYDHSNKYHRTYEPPTQSVQCNEKDASQLTAMDHARIENQLRELREQELDKLRKISNDRGQKALEREQVRRDCAELTEKLDALTQQQPQLLPTDANIIPSHRFADAAARREHKMNEAMEEMLLRPAIITCPEVRTKPTPPNSSRSKSKAPVSLNVGEPPVQMGRDNLGSTESCCSILLDYVDDQSKQLKSDLKAEQSNSLKSMRLKSLLERIEKIRVQLLEELKAGETAGSKGDNAQELHNIRQERADILSERTRTLNERESDLQQKEAILEQRLRKFYKETKSAKSSEGDQPKATAKEDSPVEIIIKVRSDGTVKQYVPRAKSKAKAKPPAVDNEKDVPLGSTESTPIDDADKQTEQDHGKRPLSQDQRQISIDSNSTAYRSLPQVSYKNLNPGVPSAPAAPVSAPLHPMVVQYINRLLGMTRQSIDEMGVSSSYVTTPSTSVINSSRNVTPCPEPEAGRTERDRDEETVISEQRVERVQTFIADNRSLIDDLEASIRCQQQLQREQQSQDTERSMRAFDQIWNKRLAKNQEECQQTNKEKEHKGEKTHRERPTAQGDRKNMSAQKENGRTPASQERERQQQSQGAVQQKRGQNTMKQGHGGVSLGLPADKSTNRFAPEKSKCQSTSEDSSARNMERYAQLTENCTQRIAELTELITKVREEKQRLVEVTLTSNSDGERQSTEYFELPTGQQRTRCRTLSDRSDSQTPSISEALPLQKHKPTAASRDSGIADSRPITAQGQICVDVEPISLGSSTQNTTARGRMKAPPATIRRYSPQLNAEDLAHELSTITEVETPGQSNIVAATPLPKPFPSFDQYARELQLDLSRLDADQSRRLQGEFNELVHVINQRSQGTDYREFPSINAYLHNMTSTHIHLEIGQDADQDTLSPGELLRQLRVVNDNIQEFPKRREYFEKLMAKQPADQRDLIDSDRLENDSSDSFNIEEELRQRKILKNSFRRGNATDSTLAGREVASSTRRESVPPETNDQPNESGIDPLSGSNFSSDGDQRAECWHATMHQRQQQVDELCSSTSASSPERRPRKPRLRGGHEQSYKSKEDSTVQDASQIGRSLNLREFLTRELLKHHEHNGAITESSDESLKGHFLKSVLHSLSLSNKSQTPGVGVSHATGATNDRQKTSTPVGSFLSIPEKAGSLNSTGSQLFSGESRISLVNYPDGTPPIPYEQQSKLSTNQTRQSSGQIGSGVKTSHRKSPRK